MNSRSASPTIAAVIVVAAAAVLWPATARAQNNAGSDAALPFPRPCQRPAAPMKLSS